jgi:hypothetical protein
MTDIVERLETFGDAHSWAVRGDAADEIMRLRAQRDELLAALKEIANRDKGMSRLGELARAAIAAAEEKS